MDITYCANNCRKGQAARERFLNINESVFGAASDFISFTEDCFKTCPYRAEHIAEPKKTKE